MDLKLGDTRLIIDTSKANGLLRNQAAYVLATAYHETAHTMKPITELGSQKYLKSKPYWPFIGRGYVQLTWEANYKKASDELGLPMLLTNPPKSYFVGNPEELLNPKYAAPILVIGMAEGWFTGKKLSTYITVGKSDFIGARRIINGTDKASLIAGYAQQYDDLLMAEGYDISGPSVSPAVTPSVERDLPAAPAQNATVVTVDGPKKDETTVVITKTPQSPPASPGLPTSKTGFLAIGAIIIAIITGIIKFFGG